MPYCDPTGKQDLVALLFAIISLGALVSFLGFSVFAYKWFYVLNTEHRANPVPRLSFVISFSLFYERCLRVAEFQSRFYGTKQESDIWYHANWPISMAGIVLGILLMLTLRLKTTFEESIYKVSDKELRIMYTVISLIMLVLYAWSVLNGVPYVYQSSLGALLLSCLALCAFILAVTAFYILNSGFIRRLQILVATATANSQASRTDVTMTSHVSQIAMLGLNHPSNQTGGASPSLSNPTPPAIDRAGSEMTEGNEKRNSVMDYIRGSITVSKNGDHIPAVIHESTLRTGSRPGHARTSTLDGIRNARIENFGSSHNRQILLTASKSAIIGLWVTLSSFLYFLSTVFFAIGECFKPEWSILVGHSLICVGALICSSAVYFNLAKSKVHYQKYCGKFDHLIQKVVAFQTDQEVTTLQQKQISAYQPSG